MGRAGGVGRELKVPGTRHGEKLYETLATREELARATDQAGGGEMARPRAAQRAASPAEPQARETTARKAAERADTEGLTAIPIPPQRAAELAAQAAAAASSVQRSAESTETRFPSTQFAPPTRAAAVAI